MKIYNNSFLLTNEISDNLKKNIYKFKNISVIYYNLEETDRGKYLNNCNSVYNFCRKKNLSFYITDNINLCFKYKCKGMLITNAKGGNNYTYIKNQFHIMGKAHNQLEYSLLVKKGCKTVLLSPLFYNHKYSINKILGPIRFNLIVKNWVTKIGTLGGINLSNMKRIAILQKISGIYFKSLINNM